MYSTLDSDAPGQRAPNLRRRIYEDLRQRLRQGEFDRDARLVDVDLARAAGISRMPVREALLQLTIEGHLVGTTRGFAVPQLSAQDIADIFEIRRLTEPRAAAAAARDLDDEGLATLARCLQTARRAVGANSFDLLSEANIRFRETWLAALRNRRLAEVITRFSDQAQIVRQGTLSIRSVQFVVLDGLEGLHDAFRRRDSLDAHDRMAAFMAEAEHSYFDRLRGDSSGAGEEDT
ncbi:FCD domain-containing protein [Paracoccus sp. S-4012]|uniref:GntR family transcriptional regulator n=1 Tax=Paracoccus sp. S-4012 TaxID=2665648 RepID=UPI0012B0D578|nr:GntR family transcriptional regulator [Paracoccus sp. S-4012]MRX49561.1 FCD domain-containing protein [Paracoccus sp. S-4012]